MLVGPNQSRVLVIDDHADVLESLLRVLGAWGYEAEGAVNGAMGLTSFFSRPPDVVLMDLALPDIKGCEIIRGMRAALDDVLSIAYSGYEELLPLAINAGADSSVLKPNLDGLKDVLAIGGAIGTWRRSRRGDYTH